MHPRSTRCFHVHAMSGSEMRVLGGKKHTGKWEEVRVHKCVNASVGVNTCVCVQVTQPKTYWSEPKHTSVQSVGISSTDHLEIQDEIPRHGISEGGELRCSVKLKCRWSHLWWHHIFAAHRVTSRCRSHIQTTAPFAVFAEAAGVGSLLLNALNVLCFKGYAVFCFLWSRSRLLSSKILQLEGWLMVKRKKKK